MNKIKLFTTIYIVEAISMYETEEFGRIYQTFKCQGNSLVALIKEAKLQMEESGYYDPDEFKFSIRETVWVENC